MCGISGIVGGAQANAENLTVRIQAMVRAQSHRGPDAEGHRVDPSGRVALGHNRLSIIDLSPAGRQPMPNYRQDTWIVFNGEVYNYLELRTELADYPYVTRTDTEVILAAYERWGTACLDHFVGMFSFILWDEAHQVFFAARDRFGVKPLYYSQQTDGTLLFASEIKTLFAGGQAPIPNQAAWANFLVSGMLDYCESTFWENVQALPAGYFLLWQNQQMVIRRWYNLAERIASGFDQRSFQAVQEEYLELLTANVRLRFRSDVPVGLNLSGGLDSSTLVGLVKRVLGGDEKVKTFTFVTNHADYDELPWVAPMLAQTQYESIICALAPEDVPALAESVQYHQDEPYGGLPTLAYARLFEIARAHGVIVLLDGQGMDEQWAGYDYYQKAVQADGASPVVQGTNQSPVRPDCLAPDFRQRASTYPLPEPFADRLRNLQYRDAFVTKIPRALRYNDRISMRVSTELREPFLDHRLFELAFQQPAEFKIHAGQGKWILRDLAAKLLPNSVAYAPKRPLQTPQREWLRGPLKDWAGDMLAVALREYGGVWFNPALVQSEWQSYLAGNSDNSFYIWQWISAGMLKNNLGLYAGLAARF